MPQTRLLWHPQYRPLRKYPQTFLTFVTILREHSTSTATIVESPFSTSTITAASVMQVTLISVKAAWIGASPVMVKNTGSSSGLSEVAWLFLASPRLLHPRKLRTRLLTLKI